MIRAAISSQFSGQCHVQPDPCRFPFNHENRQFDSCTAHNASTSAVCKTGVPDAQMAESGNPDARWAWSTCNAQCFHEDGRPIVFEGDDYALSVFCKAEPAPCVFPFVYNGVEYAECTEVDSSAKWCATLTDEENNMVEGFWGRYGHIYETEIIQNTVYVAHFCQTYETFTTRFIVIVRPLPFVKGLKLRKIERIFCFQVRLKGL